MYYNKIIDYGDEYLTVLLFRTRVNNLIYNFIECVTIGSHLQSFVVRNV